jgi:hypothetical protein
MKLSSSFSIYPSFQATANEYIEIKNPFRMQKIRVLEKKILKIQISDMEKALKMTDFLLIAKIQMQFQRTGSFSPNKPSLQLNTSAEAFPENKASLQRTTLLQNKEEFVLSAPQKQTEQAL